MNNNNYIFGKYSEKNDCWESEFSTCPNCGNDVFVGEPYGAGDCECGAHWCWEYYVKADSTILDWSINNKPLLHGKKE